METTIIRATADHYLTNGAIIAESVACPADRAGEWREITAAEAEAIAAANDASNQPAEPTNADPEELTDREALRIITEGE